MSLVGDVSAVATLILFVLYFFGRILKLYKDSKYPNLDMTIDIKQTVDDYDTFDIDLRCEEVVIAKYDQSIKWFKVSEIEWYENMAQYNIKKKVGCIEYISANTEITICTTIP
jgi:hypothetical protein